MSKYRFTLDEILMGRATFESLPKQLQINVRELQVRLTTFFAGYKKPLIVSSGYRPASINAAAGGALNSTHMLCLALDIRDSGKVWKYILNNLPLAQELGIWFEDKRHTPTWVHCQIRAPKSGRRIYMPNTKPPIAPDAWDGQYEGKYNGSENSF